MASYAIMKLVILLALFLPISSLLLIFSLVNLLFYKEGKQVKLALASTVKAQNLPLTAAIPVPTIIPFSLTQDIRVLTLKRFLEDYRSPLVDFSEELVREADLWGLDYALLPAIAMQESSGCKVIPVDSHNCWGFGIYGDKMIKFTSYKEAMHQVARTIKETYIKNGLTNPTLLEDRWAPQSKGIWSYAVNYFIGKIREYERTTPAS